MIDATRIHSFNSFVRMMYAYRGLRTHGVRPCESYRLLILKRIQPAPFLGRADLVVVNS